MVTPDLIREARSRAGLTQTELADRLAKPQSTIRRWESGAAVPSLETVREALNACGLELTIGLARADTSYLPLIDEQLASAPASRIARRAAGADLAPAINALQDHGAAFVLAGPAVEAFWGSPINAAHRPITVVPDLGSLGAARGALDELGARELRPDAWTHAPAGRTVFTLGPHAGIDELVVDEQPAGTRGFPDLNRKATAVLLTPDAGMVQIASLADLVRIAGASTDLDERARVPALRATLERTRARQIAARLG